MTKRTIAWLISGNEGYGVRQAVLQLIQTIRENGWSTPIISLRDEVFAEECRQHGFEVHALNVDPSPWFGGGLWKKPSQLVQAALYQRRVAPAISEVLEKVSADAIHILWPNLVRLAGLAASKNQIPVFWEMPNILGDRYLLHINRWLYQYTCKKYDILPLANSKSTAATLGNWLVTPEVLYLGVDPDRFNLENVKSVSRDELGIPQDATVLGIVSRLSHSKGQDRVLEAMLSLEAKNPSLHLLLLGGPKDGEFADSIRTLASKAEATDRLHLMGPVPQPEQYYAMMDIAVNCRVDNEPFGISVIEAMMMKRPILVHAFGGPAETVIDGETGWHIHDPSVKSIAQGIQRVLDDRSRWKEMGDNAREHAVEHFSKDCQAQNYVAIVERVLGERHERR